MEPDVFEPERERLKNRRTRVEAGRRPTDCTRESSRRGRTSFVEGRGCFTLAHQDTLKFRRGDGKIDPEADNGLGESLRFRVSGGRGLRVPGRDSTGVLFSEGWKESRVPFEGEGNSVYWGSASMGLT